MNRSPWIRLLALAACLPWPADAQTCQVTATPLAFGPYAAPHGPRVDSSATVQVQCTPAYLLLGCQVSYSLSLSAGLSPAGGHRHLRAGTATLPYTLHSDPARSQPWGDGSELGPPVAGRVSTSLLGLVCLPGNRVHTLYGRIPGGQNVPPGGYADQLVLTVTY
jgi:spore coat protein U-like protein